MNDLAGCDAVVGCVHLDNFTPYYSSFYSSIILLLLRTVNINIVR